MPTTIMLEYKLTRELWRHFFEAHYGCDQSLKMRYLWGVTCIIIGCFGFGGFYESKVIAVLLLATGFFGVLSKQLLIIKSLRGACHHPFLGKELTVTITAEDIAVRSGMAGYDQPWSNFVGYRHLKPGFLLYHDQNAFFFIPASVVSANHADCIIKVLEAAEVPRL
jgi:hypothetical protein